MFDDVSSTVRQYWWFALLAASIASTIPVAYLLAPPAAIGFEEWVGVFGTVNSLALSLVLVFLYRQMSETQADQTELMDQQKQLLKRKQQPLIEVQGVSIETDASETRITAKVMNKAITPIQAPMLGLGLVLYGENAEKIGISPENPVMYQRDEWRIEPVGKYFQRETMPDSNGEIHLESGETATLVAPVTFRGRNRETEKTASLSFRDLSEMLRETGIGMIKLQASLIYTGRDGYLWERCLSSGKAELSTFETLDELFTGECKPSELPFESLARPGRSSTSWTK